MQSDLEQNEMDSAFCSVQVCSVKPCTEQLHCKLSCIFLHLSESLCTDICTQALT